MDNWELKQRNKSIDICCSKCGYVRVEEYAYNYEIYQLNKQDILKFIEENSMNYCEKCGTKMEGIK